MAKTIYDAWGGIVRTVEEAEDGRTAFAAQQDCTAILKHNRAFRNEVEQHGEMRKAATIPLIILEQWARENGISSPFSDEMGEIVKRKLNDPDWAYLRTNNGVV